MRGGILAGFGHHRMRGNTEADDIDAVGSIRNLKCAAGRRQRAQGRGLFRAAAQGSLRFLGHGVDDGAGLKALDGRARHAAGNVQAQNALFAVADAVIRIRGKAEHGQALAFVVFFDVVARDLLAAAKNDAHTAAGLDALLLKDL